MKPQPLISDYGDFLSEVKGGFIRAFAAGRAVNRELVMLYWDIGAGL
jgi:hypothetical protein